MTKDLSPPAMKTEAEPPNMHSQAEPGNDLEQGYNYPENHVNPVKITGKNGGYLWTIPYA